MRIIKNNYIEREKNTREHVCDNCGSVFEYDEDERHVGAFGQYFITCPCCNETIALDDGVSITEYNVRFPTHYYHFNGDSAMRLDDSAVDEMVRSAIKGIREHGGDYVSCSTGDTMVFITRLDDEGQFFVYVGKNGYETTIEYQIDDYMED